MDNTALYYDKFLTLVCEYWRDEIKSATPGHCMKITGLPMQELKYQTPRRTLRTCKKTRRPTITKIKTNTIPYEATNP